MTGPMANAAGHDLNYSNIAGITELTGHSTGGPAMSEVPIADTAGGSLYATIAILLALAAREKTGKGQICDVAMTDSAITLLAYSMGEWSGHGKLPQRGNEFITGAYAFYNVYECRDGKHVSLAAIEKKFWVEFCKRLNKEEYIAEQTNIDKQATIKADIRNIMLQKTRDEWVDFFADSDICFTPVLNLEEMAYHPQVQAREMVKCLPNFNNSGKDLYLTGLPIKLSENPGEVKLQFPKLGENNEEILKLLGYSPEEIKQLKSKQVI